MKKQNPVTISTLLILSLSIGVSCTCETTSEPNGNGVPDDGRRIDFWPKWCSTDTGRIGYTHSAKDWDELQQLGQFSIWIVHIVTGEAEHVTEGVLEDWSPDGSQILFSRYGEGILLRDLATDIETVVPIAGTPMDFSPSGREIAYVGGDSLTGVYIFNLDSRTATWVAERYHCDWSPDGEAILCDSLIIIGRDGERLAKVPLGPGPGRANYARWSPEGNRIAFGGGCENNQKDPAIWVVNTDGSGLRMVVCRGAVPTWSPDGKVLAYSATSSEGTDTAIWISNVDGTGSRQVTFP